MGGVLSEGAVEGRRAEEDDPPQALALDGADETLGQGVAVRSPRGAEQRADAGVLQDGDKRGGKLGVAVKDQEPRGAQESVHRVGEQLCDPGHEHAVRIRRRRDDLDRPGRVVDHEEGMMGHEPAKGPDLGREEVGGEDGRRMSFQKRLPGSALPALGRRIETVPPEDVPDSVGRDAVTEVQEGALDAIVPQVGFSRAIRIT